jgi:hypothetical protein
VVGKTKTPTKAEKDRMTILKEHVPCIPCLLATRKVRLPSIQHTVSGMTRDGHMSTYSACDWHHFGIRQEGSTNQQMSGMLGPPLTFGRREYESFFGPESLLVAIASKLVSNFQEYPWMDYDVPYETRRRAIHFWIDKHR